MREYIVTEHPDFPYEDPKPQELIRCKDCRAWERHKDYARLGTCAMWHGAERAGSDYCSEGVRKDGEQDG